MTRKRDWIDQILSRQARGFPSRPFEVLLRLGMLRTAYGSGLDKQLLRYFPIGIVTCFETFFKATAKLLVDSGSPYLERAANSQQMRESRFSLEVLRALQGDDLTVGDLVAHLLDFGRLAQIDATMSLLLDSPFLELVKAAQLAGESQPIIGNPLAVFADVEKVFDLRHIFAHELAEIDDADAASVPQYLQSARWFLDASEAVVTRILYPNAPRTQAEMNVEAARLFREAEEERKQVLAKLAPLAGGFEEAEGAWERYRDLAVEFEARFFEGGTIYPTIRSSTATWITEEHVKRLRRVLEIRSGS